MRTCLIVGNGPSLKDVPNTFLAKYPTFGSNRCYLKFVPDYYASVNPLVIQQCKREINDMQCMKFIRSDLAKLIPGSFALPISNHWAFHKNPLLSVHEGWTVTFVLMQLAYFLDYHTVGLVGVDHRFTYTGKPNEQKRMEGDDPNHFSSEYFKGMEWNNPDLERSRKSYIMAKAAFEQGGRKIVNLTKNSDLDVFPFDDWRKWNI